MHFLQNQHINILTQVHLHNSCNSFDSLVEISLEVDVNFPSNLGSEPSFLDANRQSPRASSAGDSLISETEAHQSG